MLDTMDPIQTSSLPNITIQPSNASSERIMIIAGETSGDMHSSELVNQLKKQHQHAYFYGVGGESMEAAGVDVQHDLSQYSVIGLSGVFKHLKVYYRVYRDIMNSIKNDPPDVLILIDAPAFNLRIAKNAKRLGVKNIVYYISPQIWAWRAKRIHLIKRCVDLMAVILPFEKAIYDAENIPVIYTGHPLSKTVKTSNTTDTLKNIFKLSRTKKIIGLLPGSRSKEISRLLPCMLNVAQKLQKEFPDIEFILPLANNKKRDLVDDLLSKSNLSITVVVDKTYDAISCCHSVMICSGTATLETCLLHTPMCIIYKPGALTYFLGSILVKVPFIGLPNLLAGREIVPELIGMNATENHLYQHMKRLLCDETYYKAMKQDLINTANSLDASDTDDSLAERISEMLKKTVIARSKATKQSTHRR